MQTKSAGSLLLMLGLSLYLNGCVGSGQSEKFHGPDAPAAIHTEPWTYNDDDGVLIHTDHYNIYTTIADPELRARLAEVMEGALGEYQRLAPGVPISNRPMNCYLFRNRDEWADYTVRHTGGGAITYLTINRGGYTLTDWYCGYYLGSPISTEQVAAHEGWHQFCSRNFKGRLPPFLEEGIATMFEDLEFDHELPRWNLARNRTRLQSLRDAVEGNYMYSLAELSQLHAGNVVAGSGNKTQAFYGQSWAFATFLWTADDAKYRPALRQMLSDVADGTVFDPTGAHQNAMQGWNPAGVKPMLEHYLGMSMEQINVEYQKYIRKVAFDEYAKQWD